MTPFFVISHTSLRRKHMNAMSSSFATTVARTSNFSFAVNLRGVTLKEGIDVDSTASIVAGSGAVSLHAVSSQTTTVNGTTSNQTDTANASSTANIVTMVVPMPRCRGSRCALS